MKNKEQCMHKIGLLLACAQRKSPWTDSSTQLISISISNGKGSNMTDQATKPREHSMTLSEWCDHRRVSRASYYKLKDQGLMPKTYRVGAKLFISAEADRAWLAQREEAAA